ncbi:MAG: hypothetical protein GYA17_16500 [Chloroflexi bacterium]|jgi:predicted nucleic acid-binding Zn ribbon protein|nr:hypothetical protein [Anaerolineaceae bacterium]NMB89960.1 hypothetical protein [Chloroflexota bacterium]
MKKQNPTEKKTSGHSYEQRRRRTQQIVFAVLAVIIILSWIVSMIAAV